jgi:hypothetical protein
MFSPQVSIRCVLCIGNGNAECLNGNMKLNLSLESQSRGCDGEMGGGDDNTPRYDLADAT